MKIIREEVIGEAGIEGSVLKVCSVISTVNNPSSTASSILMTIEIVSFSFWLSDLVIKWGFYMFFTGQVAALNICPFKNKLIN